MIKKNILKTSVCLIFFIICFCHVFSQNKADTKDKKILQNDELLKLQLKKKELNIKLQTAEKQQKEFEKELKKINGEIRYLQNKMNKTTEEIDLITDKIEQMKDKIIRAQQLQDQELLIFKNRLREMYKRRKFNYINAVFDAKEISSFLKRLELLKRVLNKDIQSIRKLRAAIQAVTVTQKTFEDKKNEMKALLDEQKNSRIELDRKNQHKQKLLKALSHKKGVWEKRSDEYDKEIEALIKRLIEKQKEEEKKREIAKKPPVLKKKVDKLIWPVGDISQIVNKFGTVKDDEYGTSRFNAGIDINIRDDEKIKCSAEGIVLYKGGMRGYGNLVIVDHGSNIVTVYAGLKTIGVRINQHLKEGEILGTGNEGIFHFEVRKSSVSVDPLTYLM